MRKIKSPRAKEIENSERKKYNARFGSLAI